jgi:hypothetical protein
MFVQQMSVLCDVSVVEVGNPKIKKDIKKEGKIEDCKIKTEFFSADRILNGPVNAKHPEGFYKQIQK